MGQEALICRKRDKILSNEGEKTVLGPKNNVVNAGGGADILIGGRGNDILNGGRGQRHRDRRPRQGHRLRGRR